MKNARRLTPAEFELMEILWKAKTPLSVAAVLEAIRANKDVAYTTVMTLLDRMARKGSLRRIRKGKAYLYSPRVNRPEVVEFLIRDFQASYGFRPSHPRPARKTQPTFENPEDMDVTLL